VGWGEAIYSDEEVAALGAMYASTDRSAFSSGHFQSRALIKARFEI
jgi:hypothetical protein